jgi:hypothetical protein
MSCIWIQDYIGCRRSLRFSARVSGSLEIVWSLVPREVQRADGAFSHVVTFSMKAPWSLAAHRLSDRSIALRRGELVL